MIQQSNLFREPITIENNKKLEDVCNDILRAVSERPDLLDGDKPGIIDRKITVWLWISEIRKIVPDPEQRGRLTQFLCDPERCISFDIISRARRLLVEQDKLRLSAAAITQGILNKQRVEKSLRK